MEILVSSVKDVVAELFELGKLALPSILNNSLEISMLVTDILMLGHLGKGHLAAASIGTSYFNISWVFIEGVLTSQDILSAQAFGMNDLKILRSWLYVSAAVSTLLCIIGTMVSLLGYLVINYIFQINKHVAFKAALHVVLLIPNLWFLSGFRVLQKFLLAQNVVMPPIYCSILGNAVNIFMDYFLIFTTGIGFAGVGVATSIARACMFGCLLTYILRTQDCDTIREEISEILSTGEEELSIIFPISKSCCVSMKCVISSTITVISRRFERAAKTASGADGSRKISGNQSTIDDDDDAEVGLLSASGSPSSSRGHGERNGVTATSSSKNYTSPHSNAYPQFEGQDSIGTSEAIEMIVRSNRSPPVPLEGAGASRRHPIHTKINTSDLNTSRIQELKSVFSCAAPGARIPDFREDNSAARLLYFRAVRFLSIGLPGGVLLGLDTWVFDVMVIVTAQLGTVALGAQQILVTLTLFAYVSMPFALGTAASVRIGHLLGARDCRSTALSARVTLTLGCIIMGICGVAVYYLSDVIGRVFTDDSDVQYRVTELAPVLACFQVAYGVQGVAQGLLRGIGWQAQLAGLTFFAVWVIGMPTGLYLVYLSRPSFGLTGLWTGLASGMASLAALLVVLVLYVDWGKEEKKFLLKLSRAGSGDYFSGVPQAGSRGVGGLDFVSDRLLEELQRLDDGDGRVVLEFAQQS